jgi:Putative bacterial sensory transduction regulator
MSVVDVLREALDGMEFEQPGPDRFIVQLPGEQRLKTAVLLIVGEHALTIQAFVMRKPDENHEQLYRFLLQQNTRMYAVAWSLDNAGDVYLTGRIALEAVSTDEIDRVLGVVLQHADGMFNEMLKLGFGSSIRREWAWRVKRGESLANLAAFEEFARPPDSSDPAVIAPS